jgi:hypothetical protein
LAAVEIWLSFMQQGQECKSRCEYFLSRIRLLELLLLRGFVAEPQMLCQSLKPFHKLVLQTTIGYDLCAGSGLKILTKDRVHWN